MNFTIFTEEIEKALKAFYGDKTRIDFKEVLKNNGVRLHSVSILKEGQSICPTVYLDNLYQEYERKHNLGKIVAEIVRLNDKNVVPESMNMDFFLDYEKVKGRLFYKLINYEKNALLLQDVPHKKFLDLAIICYYAYMNDCLGNGTIMIKKEHLERWEITEVEIFQIAGVNTREKMGFELIDMEEIVMELLEKQCVLEELGFPEGEAGEYEESGMYVLTNKSRFLGAACIVFADILAHIARKLESDFFVLPSSIHEVIILPGDMGNGVEKLRSMVGDINETQVSPEEVLADTIYFYDRRDQRIKEIS